MGRVNNYIKNLMKFITKEKKNYEYPWQEYYGDDIPHHINYYKGSLYDRLRETANQNEKRVAIRYFGSEITFGKFMRKIDDIAACLKQFDIVPNEAVTVCLPNSPESFALIYAINKVGAIANVVHPLSSTQDIERALSETNSDTLFCADVSMPKARGLKVDHFVMVPTSYSFNPVLKTLYNFKERANMKLEDNMMTFDEFLSYYNDEDTYVRRNGEDPAAIIYSGGTTGKPKGIIISNTNFNAMAQQTYALCDTIRPGNSVLSALPIFHVFGLAICCHACLTAGMTCIVLPKINTKNINGELKKHKPNVFPAVPSLLRLSLQQGGLKSNDLDFLKLVVVGGDYLPPELRKEFIEFAHKHGSDTTIEVGYGLSEATGFACCTVPLPEEEKASGSLGVPNPDMIIRVFEPNSDVEKSTGDIGEVCITGPTIMMGYINEDEETKKTLVRHNDGRIWLHTGDLGYMDDKGKLFYSSRLKRMIITNGYNVYPVELEDILSKNEYIETSTVIGIPHPTKGQTPKAVIVLKDGVEDNIEIRSAIRKYCKANMAAYAVPTEFEYRTSLPLTAVGKVAYTELQESEKKDESKGKN